MNRREALKAAGGAAAVTILGGIPILGKATNAGDTAAANADTQPAANAASTPSAGSKRKILVIGAHPDDPETGAGGTICLLTQAGHQVVCVYLTRGEAGIRGKSHSEAAAIREKEAINACAVTGASYIFMDQIDGSTEINRRRYDEMRELIEKETPDVVITHWPIDSHRDHAICGALVLDAWRRLDRSFELYYFEVMTGTQTQMFHPTEWVNIESVLDRKYKACYCHESQQLEEVMKDWHGPMERFRGIECRCNAAEAFVHHTAPGML